MKIDLDILIKKKQELNLSYDEIAALSGVSRRAIIGILRGEIVSPRIDTLQAIEQALGLEKSDGGEELTEKERRLLRAFNRLVPPMQDYVIEMIEKLEDTQTTGVKIG